MEHDFASEGRPVNTYQGIIRTPDGRPVIGGCGSLSPVDDPVHPTQGNAREQDPKPKTLQHLSTNRFAVLNAFVDSSLAGLNKSEIATWLVLYRDVRDGIASASQSEISRRAGISVRSVRKAIRSLVVSGLLVVIYQGGLNRGPSKYNVQPLRNARAAGLRKKGVGD